MRWPHPHTEGWGYFSYIFLLAGGQAQCGNGTLAQCCACGQKAAQNPHPNREPFASARRNSNRDNPDDVEADSVVIVVEQFDLLGMKLERTIR